VISTWPGIALYQQWLLDAVLAAEKIKVTFDFLGLAGRLQRVVGKLDRRPPVGARDLAHQRDRRQRAAAIRFAADEIIGQIGPPAEAHAHLSTEMAIGA